MSIRERLSGNEAVAGARRQINPSTGGFVICINFSSCVITKPPPCLPLYRLCREMSKTRTEYCPGLAYAVFTMTKPSTRLAVSS